MTTTDAVQRRLLAKAQLRAADLGFALNCENEVKEMIKSAAQTLEREGFLTNPDRLSVAEKNIELFVSVMLEEAYKRGDSQLREGTFRTAKGILCPLWPFC